MTAASDHRHAWRRHRALSIAQARGETSDFAGRADCSRGTNGLSLPLALGAMRKSFTKRCPKRVLEFDVQQRRPEAERQFRDDLVRRYRLLAPTQLRTCSLNVCGLSLVGWIVRPHCPPVLPPEVRGQLLMYGIAQRDFDCAEKRCKRLCDAQVMLVSTHCLRRVFGALDLISPNSGKGECCFEIAPIH